MARERINKYQYETSPRKIEPEYRPQRKKSTQTRNKIETKKEIVKKAKEKVKVKKAVQRNKRKMVMYVLVVFGILLAISYRNSLINENFAEIKNLKSELQNIEKETKQLQVSIESSLNLNNVEQAAKEKLGMQKLSNNQKIYISLPKKDYVEPAIEEVQINNNEKWFSKVIDIIAGK